MIPTTHFFTLILLVAGFGACQSEAPPPAAEPPVMTRETPPPRTTSLERPKSPSDSGAGNFESLVADYESKDRVIWQKPGMVISLLGDLKGKTVADIGAGTGYFAFRMVPQAEKVIAIDIDPRFIAFMDSVKVRLPAIYRDRLDSRLAKPDDPMLAPEEADAVVMVNTYGYINNRMQYLQRLASGMKPGGNLLIIDFKKNNLPVGPEEIYKVSLRQVEAELESGGFVITKVDNQSLDYQYIVIATKQGGEAGR